ncbi:MAG: cupredoxin domain-containing protein [Nitrospirota bacterium]|nr:cupredoxin domain-containing protein [Nitrospirota bacterium]
MRHAKYSVTALFLLSALIVHADEVKEKSVVATTDADGVQRIEVTGGDYYFEPNYIVVKSNVPVELTIKKESGIVPHNIIIKAPEAGIAFSEKMGTKPKVIRFTPTRPGKYEIECDKRLLFFKNHKEKGMKGTLEVAE